MEGGNLLSEEGLEVELQTEFLFTHFSEFGGPNMDIFGGKSEDFGRPLHQIYFTKYIHFSEGIRRILAAQLTGMAHDCSQQLLR